MSEPNPPLNYVSPNNYENRWKISPSLLGGLRGQMKMYKFIVIDKPIMIFINV